MITREQALVLIKKYIKDRDLIKRSLAVETILREIARRLHKDEELWGLTGLLYNIDYEYVGREPENRGTLASQLLDGLIPEAGVNAIKSINYMHTNYTPITSLDKSLIAADAVTGLIFNTAHSLSLKNFSEIDIDVLLDKLNDPSSANINNRNRVKLCNDVGMDLDVFLALSLNIVKKISNEPGP